MERMKKNCPECGNKLNYSPADKIYTCPYCGEEFTDDKGELVKMQLDEELDAGLSKDQMKQELEEALKEMPVGAQLADEEKKRKRKKDDAELFELRLKLNEARLMIKTARTRGIGLCILFDVVILALTYNYDVLLHGIVGAFVLTIATYLYLSSYAAKIEKWRVRLESEAKELEKDVYVEDEPSG